MSAAIKGTSRRLYLSDQDIKGLKSVSAKTGLSQTEILNQIFHAGLACIVEKENCQIILPLTFQMVKHD